MGCAEGSNGDGPGSFSQNEDELYEGGLVLGGAGCGNWSIAGK